MREERERTREKEEKKRKKASSVIDKGERDGLIQAVCQPVSQSVQVKSSGGPFLAPDFVFSSFFLGVCNMQMDLSPPRGSILLTHTHRSIAGCR